jgi:LPXTG-motif cell wall-anchored protein
MKKLTSLGVAAVVAALALLWWSPAAQAYPDVRIDLTVDRQVLYGGESFTATAKANVDCAWNLDWDGRVRSDNGTRKAWTFTADEVSRTTQVPLHGTCVYAASGRGSATWERTLMITVQPASAAVSPPSASDLPSTGGPNWYFLLVGVVLLMSGAGAVVVARWRAEQADVVTFRV